MTEEEKLEQIIEAILESGMSVEEVAKRLGFHLD